MAKVGNNSIEVRYVPKDQAHFYEGFISPALSYGDGSAYSVGDVVSSLSSGERILFVAIENSKVLGGAVAEIVDYPRERHLLVFTLAGSRFADWVDEMERILKRYAEGVGACCLSAHTRVGLGRILKGRGWKHEAEVVRLSI